MLSTIAIGTHDLFNQRRMTLAMALVLGIALFGFLVLKGFEKGVSVRYPRSTWPYLIIQQEGSLGEFYGSRLTPSTGESLRAAGVSQVLPEIHTITGTSHQDAVLLRGVPLDGYTSIEDFRMLAGRPLLPGDPDRTVMVGAQLAETHQLAPGDTYSIRGRDFIVIGVFQVGSYADFEAWVPLETAQSLLGWDRDVSVYIIPDEGVFEVGDRLAGGAMVVRQGESSANVVREWKPLIELLSGVNLALGLAAGISMANLLWRMAWLHRRQLAILKSVGFGRVSLAAYLFGQGTITAVLGYTIGLVGALGLAAVASIEGAGISVEPVFDGGVILASLAFAGLIALVGTALPAWWLSRLNLARLLQAQ